MLCYRWVQVDLGAEVDVSKTERAQTLATGLVQQQQSEPRYVWWEWPTSRCGWRWSRFSASRTARGQSAGDIHCPTTTWLSVAFGEVNASDSLVSGYIAFPQYCITLRSYQPAFPILYIHVHHYHRHGLTFSGPPPTSVAAEAGRYQSLSGTLRHLSVSEVVGDPVILARLLELALR